MAIAVRETRPSRGRAPGAGPPRFRPDIDGLRAIAILLVVAYHAGLPGMHGGFVGVDVFFVISGFLITRLLVTELDATGTVTLRRFWARRGRRLLPAASLVTVSVLLAGLFILSPLDWGKLGSDAMATATYRANLLFGGRATDYFQLGVRQSPLLHMWSLAVEEQFYVVWPVLLLVLHRIVQAGGDKASATRVRLTAIISITVLSFLYCLSLTRAGSPWAFFSPLARAWELGIGAVLALAVPAVARRWARLGPLLGVAGGALLVLALMTTDQHTDFPGSAALLPTLAAALILAAGVGRPPGAAGPVNRLLEARPLQGLGRLSYSWYLWHWPALVLGTTYLDRTDLPVRVALVLLSLVPAAVSYRLVERPVRHSPLFTSSTLRTGVLVALLVTVTAGLAVGVEVGSARALQQPFLHALEHARKDVPPLEAACASTDAQTIRAKCRSGDPAGRHTVLLIGDSHAAQWLPAIDGAALTSGLVVYNSVQGDCPSLDVAFRGELPSCTVRRHHLEELIDGIHPDLVVVSHSIGYVGALVDRSGRLIPADRQLAAWGDAMDRLATHLASTGTPLAVILDTPRYTRDPLECLARSGSTGECSISRRAAVQRLAPVHDAETAALRHASHGHVLDPTALVCDAERCPLVDGGLVTYSDSHHLTAGYSRTLASRIAPFLASALA